MRDEHVERRHGPGLWHPPTRSRCAARGAGILLSATVIAAAAGCDSHAAPAEESSTATQPSGPASPPPVAAKAASPASQPAPARAGAAAKAILRIDKPDHDFGTVWVGTPPPRLEHTFVLGNGGDAPLEIRQVLPSYGCSPAGQIPKRIEPGGTASVPFVLDVAFVHGKFTSHVDLVTNDPDHPRVRVLLRGELKRYIETTPFQAHFGRASAQEPREQIVNITNNTDQPIELQLTPPPADCPFAFELSEKTPGKEFQLLVRSKPPYKLGTMVKAAATLSTNLDAQKTLSVDAVLIPVERLDVWPPFVTARAFPPVAGRDTASAAWPVQITNHGPAPVKVLEATVNDPAVKLEVREETAGKVYRVVVHVPPGHQIPPEGRTITIKTDDPEKPTLQVPIRPDPSAAATQPAQPRPATASRPATPPRPALSLIGQPAPAFSLPTLDGKTASNEDFPRHVATVLNFVAVNCGFCRKQLPEVEKARAEYEPKGVRFVNVVETMGKVYSNEDAEKALKSFGSNLSIAPDPGNKVGALYKASGYPTMSVVGKDGKVAYVNIGSTDASHLKPQLDGLLAGKPIPQILTPPAATQPVGTQEAPTVATLIGQPAPAFSLPTVDGKTVSNQDFAGCPATVLNFVATNCGFCRRQIPEVEKIRAEYQPKGVRFVNVTGTLGRGPALTHEQLAAAMKAMGSNLEIASDPENKVVRHYQVTGFPALFIVGRDGKVVHFKSGFLNADDLAGSVRSQLDKLLAATPSR